MSNKFILHQQNKLCQNKILVHSYSTLCCKNGNDRFLVLEEKKKETVIIQKPNFLLSPKNVVI